MVFHHVRLIGLVSAAAVGGGSGLCNRKLLLVRFVWSVRQPQKENWRLCRAAGGEPEVVGGGRREGGSGSTGMNEV